MQPDTYINLHVCIYYCCLVTQLCLTLCDPIDCSMPGLPVPQHLPKFAQIHVHCIGDAVQPSYPLMPSSSALNLSQHQRLSMSHLCTSDNQNTGASASASVLSVNIQSWSPLSLTGLVLLSKGFSGVFASTIVRKHHSSLAFCLLYIPALTTKRDHWEDCSLNYMDLCWQSDVSAFQHSL